MLTLLLKMESCISRKQSRSTRTISQSHDRISILTSPTRTDAPWGIARLSQDDTLEDQNATDLAFTYKYDSAAGEGVDIYIVGT